MTYLAFSYQNVFTLLELSDYIDYDNMTNYFAVFEGTPHDFLTNLMDTT